MTSATLKSELTLEARVVALVYSSAVALAIGSAFVTTYTDFKIVSSSPLLAATVTIPVQAPPPDLRFRIPPKDDVLRFGFPEPVELNPLVEPVADTMVRSFEPASRTLALAVVASELRREVVVGASTAAANVAKVQASPVETVMSATPSGWKDLGMSLLLGFQDPYPYSLVYGTAVAWQNHKSFEKYYGGAVYDPTFAGGEVPKPLSFEFLSAAKARVDSCLSASSVKLKQQMACPPQPENTTLMGLPKKELVIERTSRELEIQHTIGSIFR